LFLLMLQSQPQLIVPQGTVLQVQLGFNARNNNKSLDTTTEAHRASLSQFF
jgi:hypothetical protein